MSTTRWIIETPCEFETGVLHDRPGTNNKPCGYLAHIFCDKCGWIQGSHTCTDRIVVDPDNLPPEAWRVLNAASAFGHPGGSVALWNDITQAFLSDPEPGDQT